MSVMLLSDATYNRVINTLSHITFKLPHTSHFQDALRTFYRDNWSKNKSGFEQAVLYSRALNWRSFKIRYHDTDNCEYAHYVDTLSDDDVYANIWQLLKSMECISYQIETEKEDTRFTKLIELVRNTAIESVPEYTNAKWAQ